MSAEGLGELIGDLTRAAATVERRTSEARDRAAERIRDHARQNVAVRTGATQRSIEASAGEVGPSTPYAPHVERGTYKDPPQPFMEPALDAHAEGFVKDVSDVAGDI